MVNSYGYLMTNSCITCCSTAGTCIIIFVWLILEQPLTRKKEKQLSEKSKSQLISFSCPLRTCHITQVVYFYENHIDFSDYVCLLLPVRRLFHQESGRRSGRCSVSWTAAAVWLLSSAPGRETWKSFQQINTFNLYIRQINLSWLTLDDKKKGGKINIYVWYRSNVWFSTQLLNLSQLWIFFQLPPCGAAPTVNSVQKPPCHCLNSKSDGSVTLVFLLS